MCMWRVEGDGCACGGWRGSCMCMWRVEGDGWAHRGRGVHMCQWMCEMCTCVDGVNVHTKILHSLLTLLHTHTYTPPHLHPSTPSEDELPGMEQALSGEGVPQEMREEEGQEEVEREEAPRINVEIPRCVAQLGSDLHFVKLPNFLSVETR